MPTDRLILIGAGGHARVAFDAAQGTGMWRHIEVRDDSAKAFLPGVAVVVPAVPPAVTSDMVAHVAIGHSGTRQRLAERLTTHGAVLATIVHPRAVVVATATIDAGTLVCAQAIIAAAARVGVGVIVNHAAIVDHDCVVGPWCHVAPGAILGGGVVLGAGVLVGAGAVVLPGLTIGDGASIGAGAVVTRPVASNATVVGVPARSRMIPGSKQ